MGSSFKFNTTLERSELMKKIRSKNTTPEINLRKEIYKYGFRYRINFAKLPGKPDIVFTRSKVVVFIDGEFWHGYNWENKKNRIKSNREYWVKKIENNINRDKVNEEKLKILGYKVIRFWEQQIKNDLNKCVSIVIKFIDN